MSGVLDNILHLSPLWLLGTAVLPVFLEDAIFQTESELNLCLRP